MAREILVLKPDGTQERIPAPEGGSELLHKLQEVVGGYVTLLPHTWFDHPDVRQVAVNEDGEPLRLPPNPKAGEHIRWIGNYPLLGNVACLIGCSLE